MKKMFKFMLLACVVLCAGTMVGCSDDETNVGGGNVTEMALELVNTESGGAVLKLTTNGMAKYAYEVYEKAPLLTPEPVMIFNSGKQVDCVDGENEIHVTGCMPSTTYTVYVAAQTVNDSFHKEVLSVEFTTNAIEDLVTVMSTDYQGYSLFVKLPPEVKSRGNVVRYALYDFAMYSYLRSGGMAIPREDASLLMNSKLWFGDDEEEVYINYNNDNVYLTDENGNPLVGDEGEYLINHLPISPNEPTVLMLGEFTETRPDQSHYGDWMTPMFDYNSRNEDNGGIAPAAQPMAAWDENNTYYDDQCWTGYHSRTLFQTKAPEVLDAKLNIALKSVGAVRATITVNPDPEVKQYTIMLLTTPMYEEILAWINGDESLMQWLTSSYFGYNICYSQSYKGPIEYILERDWKVEPEQEWHVFAVGYGSNDGSKQCFEHFTFKTTPRTLPAPELQITKAEVLPEGEVESPYKVWYNIKCLTKNAVAGRYAADYIAEWGKMYNTGVSNSDLITQGNYLTERDLAYVNDDEGLTVGFSTLPGMTMRLGVMLYNEEETPNDVDAMDANGNNPGICDLTAAEIDDKPRVESEIFNKLEGEWTATATAMIYDYFRVDENSLGEWMWVTLDEPIKTKITISNGVTYPETLSQEIYDIYAGLNTPKDEAAVDALFEDFKKEAAVYNQRLRGQNRMLCVGFNSANTMALLPMSAFEGFYRTDYNSYDIASIFYDFGPKWYLEVDRAGNVFAPFNYEHFAPMSNWTGYVCYMAGVVAEATNSARLVGDRSRDLAFPVEIAADYNTITINPFELDKLNEDGSFVKDENGNNVKETFYPNVLYSDWGQWAISMPKYVSKLVLTRGWDGEEAAPASVKANARVDVGSTYGYELRQPAEYSTRAHTTFREPVKYEVVKARYATPEEAKANLKALVEKRYGIRK